MDVHMILRDDKVLKYLLKNEELVFRHFSVPEGESPAQFILRASNKNFLGVGDEKKAKEMQESKLMYKVSSLHVSSKICCMACNMSLEVKKSIEATMYDDVLGSSTVTLISKYCKSCKLTYYPGFYENFKEKRRWFYPEWGTYGIFVSTYCSLFSNDMLNRLICMKQKCHTTFIGKAQSYNMQHKYKLHDPDALDKRRLAEVYYKYTFILYKERYGLRLEISGSIDDALDSDYAMLYEKFQKRYSSHECDVNGCDSCLVIDGHMKAHRKICKEKGCTKDPAYKCLYCPSHSQSESRAIKENKQELINEDEYHVEKIIKKHYKKGKCLYEVKWSNYTERTLERRENIPRILIELFERYGDSTIKTEIKDRFENQGNQYINICVKDDTFCLPTCSLQVSENAYLLKTPVAESCNTEKTRCRFYQRTGGILVMGKPCGVITSIAEIIGGESISQVAEVVEYLLQNNDIDPKCIVYDDACHLKKHVDARHVYPKLQGIEMKIDRFHYPNHTDSWCKKNMDPSKSAHLKNVNTEVMEQIFAWLKGFAPSLRYMNSFNFKFYILDILDRHNDEIVSGK